MVMNVLEMITMSLHAYHTISCYHEIISSEYDIVYSDEGIPLSTRSSGANEFI